jgi:putative hydrolase of the HAD superfamily
MIRAVVFDFGNVICRFDNRIVLRRIAENTGRSLENLEEVLYQASDTILRYEKGELSSDEFFARVKAMTGLKMSQEEFAEAYSRKFIPIPETNQILRSLKGSYQLGLLSNTSEWDFERGIQMAEVFPLFDAVTVSFQVHALKPAPEIYRDILTKLNVLPEECVYIDDIEEYVVAARGVGMHAFRYRAGLLSTTLENLLTNIH